VYDAVMTMADAMQKANSIEAAKVIPALARTDREGVTGHINFDPKGDLKEGTLTLYTFKGGQKEKLAVVKGGGDVK
jgi:branched-chain amino acid transport system substrate-binding protein